MGIRVGDQLAGYRVIELVGNGGMGRVYRAVQPRLERIVALKVIRPEIAAEDAFRDRFVREARLAAAVDHPNVVPVFEAGEADGTLFVAMRWVAGPDLRRVLLAEGSLDPARAVHIITQLADGLTAAHQLGLVHRDVKPSNVLTENDRVYLSDFGLARTLSGPDEVTASTGFVGSVDYAAPELLDGQSPSPESDVYALGCVLYEMLTGSVPFPVESLLGKLHAHSQHRAPAPSGVRPQLPQGFDAVVDRALAKDPAGRFANPGQLAAEARRALHSRPARRRRLRRLSPQCIVSGVMIVLLLGVAALALARPGAVPRPRGARPGSATGRTAATRALPVCRDLLSSPAHVCRLAAGGVARIGEEGRALRLSSLSADVTRVTVRAQLRAPSGATVSAPSGSVFIVMQMTVTDLTRSLGVFEPDAATVAGRQTGLWLVNRAGTLEPHASRFADYSTQYTPAIGALGAPLANATLYPDVPFSGQLVFYYPSRELRVARSAILALHELGKGFGDMTSVGYIRVALPPRLVVAGLVGTRG